MGLGLPNAYHTSMYLCGVSVSESVSENVGVSVCESECMELEAKPEVIIIIIIPL